MFFRAMEAQASLESKTRSSSEAPKLPSEVTAESSCDRADSTASAAVPSARAGIESASTQRRIQKNYLTACAAWGTV